MTLCPTSAAPPRRWWRTSCSCGRCGYRWCGPAPCPPPPPPPCSRSSPAPAAGTRPARGPALDTPIIFSHRQHIFTPLLLVAAVLELEFLMIRFDKTERGDQRLICRSRELGIKSNESRYRERQTFSVSEDHKNNRYIYISTQYGGGWRL